MFSLASSPRERRPQGGCCESRERPLPVQTVGDAYISLMNGVHRDRDHPITALTMGVTLIRLVSSTYISTGFEKVNLGARVGIQVRTRAILVSATVALAPHIFRNLYAMGIFGQLSPTYDSALHAVRTSRRRGPWDKATCASACGGHPGEIGAHRHCDAKRGCGRGIYEGSSLLLFRGPPTDEAAGRFASSKAQRSEWISCRTCAEYSEPNGVAWREEPRSGHRGERASLCYPDYALIHAMTTCFGRVVRLDWCNDLFGG